MLGRKRAGGGGLRWIDRDSRFPLPAYLYFSTQTALSHNLQDFPLYTPTRFRVLYARPRFYCFHGMESPMKYGRVASGIRWYSMAHMLCAAAVCGAVVFWAVDVASADEFRMVNRVYVGSEKEPTSQSTTIFHKRTVYDFLESPAEITIFDPDRDRIILLNTKKKLKTELTTDEVAKFASRLKEWAQHHTNPFLKFMGSPRFEETFDDVSRELEFESPWVVYHLKTEDAESSEIAAQYKEFSDWLAKLNTLINPGAYPPYARMLVNAALAKRNEVPAEVRLNLKPKGRLQLRPISLRSEHHLVRRLVESDRRRVAQAAEYMSMFNSVSFNEYQKACRAEEGKKR